MASISVNAIFFAGALSVCSLAAVRAGAQPVPAPQTSGTVPAAAASEAAPSPDPTPELLFGSTPAQGCPRFFIGLALARLDACADRLAEAGWGLSAVAYLHRLDASFLVDHFGGSFEPDAPKRWLERDDEPTSNATGLLVNVIGASDHLVIVYQRGTAQACDDLTLYYPHDFHVADKRAYFMTKMSERAAAGCIPGSYYSLIRRDAIMQETPDEHVAFLPGDPHTTAAFWPRNGAERQAFEKRAAARGFQRLSLDDVPDRWGKTAGPRFVEDIPLGPPASRYDALEERLRAAAARRERIVDLRFEDDDYGALKGLRILWERPS